MKPLALLSTALLLASTAFGAPTPTTPQAEEVKPVARRALPGFVYSEDGKFKVDGHNFFFVGTNAYWLSQLNSVEDIVKTLNDIKSKGLTVVRTWCFRDLESDSDLPPTLDPAKYTTLWQNGKQTFNQPGADRIKFILDTAQSLGLKIQCALTNNWDVAPDKTPRPGGFLSNSYGGMDTYVRQLDKSGHHDTFYTGTDVKGAFKKWIDFIVPQFANHPALLGWELANDPRCKGSDSGLTTSGKCKATTITNWTNELGAYLKVADPNHLVASGDAGFYCVDCTKINTLGIIPPPQTSPTPQKRNVRRKGFLTKAHVLKQRRETAKKRARALRDAARAAGKGMRIRGKWSAPHVSFWARQSDSVGPGYDGSYGVDTEDIGNSPSVDYSSFQFFPDQNTYSASQGSDSTNPPDGGAGGSNFEDTLQTGIDWIQHHADSAQTFGKPSMLTGFGLVNNQDRDSFAPVDSTTVGTDTEQQTSTDEQQQQAYTSWTSQAVNAGINGVTHYQWGENNLTSQDGSAVDNTQSFSNTSDSSQGASPNDGYSTTSPAVQGILQNAAAAMTAKNQDTSG